MKIFDDGKMRCPSDKFTLGYYNSSDSLLSLSDNVSLASIVGEEDDDFTLVVTEMTCTVKETEDRWQFEVVFSYQDLDKNYADRFIRQRMKLNHPSCYFDCKSAKIENPQPIVPGSIFIVTAEKI